MSSTLLLACARPLFCCLLCQGSHYGAPARSRAPDLPHPGWPSWLVVSGAPVLWRARAVMLVLCFLTSAGCPPCFSA
eukprot:4433190-Alexandrium_andersonii.AAC.1